MDRASGIARRLLAWLPLVLVVALGTVFLTVLEPEQRAGLTESSQRATTSASAPGTTSMPTASTSGPTASVVVDHVGEALLGVDAGWELFVRGGGSLVRVELAQRRITRTELPGLNSGPVSFAVGPEQAIIRPLDHVDGYVVPDGEPARNLPQKLNHGAPLFPGPGATVWVIDSERSMAVQRRFDGTATGVTVRLPETSRPLDSDGRGSLVVESVGGVYLTKPDGLSRITTGELLAVGPTRSLVLECDDQARCSTVVVNRDESTRRVLARNAGSWHQPTGVISPDGTTAAVPLTRSGGLRLIDLSSGASDQVDAVTPPGPRGLRDRLAWSPDSEWLFAVGGSGLLAVNADSGQVRALDLGLPFVSQIAVRPESS